MKTFSLELTEAELVALKDFLGENCPEGESETLDEIYKKLEKLYS